MAEIFYPLAFVLTAGLAVAAWESWLSFLGLSLYFILLGLVGSQLSGWPMGLLHWAIGEAAALIIFVPMASRNGAMRIRWAAIEEPAVLGRSFSTLALALAAPVLWSFLARSPSEATMMGILPWLTFASLWSMAAGAVALFLYRGPLKAGVGILLIVAGGTLLALPADLEATLVILVSSSLVSLLAALSASFLNIHFRRALRRLAIAEAADQGGIVQ
ncbi:MAG: hypothetical protein HYX89_02935 [Chloroflexi bacterium]|nr:hypothetical protein [Chloroflexota bacterium]